MLSQGSKLKSKQSFSRLSSGFCRHSIQPLETKDKNTEWSHPDDGFMIKTAKNSSRDLSKMFQIHPAPLNTPSDKNGSRVFIRQRKYSLAPKRMG